VSIDIYEGELEDFEKTGLVALHLLRTMDFPIAQPVHPQVTHQDGADEADEDRNDPQMDSRNGVHTIMEEHRPSVAVVFSVGENGVLAVGVDASEHANQGAEEDGPVDWSVIALLISYLLLLIGLYVGVKMLFGSEIRYPLAHIPQSVVDTYKDTLERSEGEL
jgi:hypothetical protein